jgi:hypothetical protein
MTPSAIDSPQHLHTKQCWDDWVTRFGEQKVVYAATHVKYMSIRECPCKPCVSSRERVNSRRY